MSIAVVAVNVACYCYNLLFVNLTHAGARFIIVCVCVCVSVCVSVTTLASAMNVLKAKVRYQQKALNTGNKINIGIELKFLVRKF